ncbi:MAG: hypothetical protein M3Z17_03865 [Gemmatimonadota bacterium]|nr:hypothetical protein [Gemmatimonadota bacterium]
MTAISALWLPILLSVIAVFAASSIIHMKSPWHKSDYPAVPNEAALADAVRPLAIPPGNYVVPRPVGMADMKTAAFQEKVNRGPNLILTVIPNGPRPMSTFFVGWFFYLLVVTTAAAYVAGSVIAPGAGYGIHKYVFLVSFIGYALGLWPESIWHHRKWSTTVKLTFDALIYALITAFLFGWLWPK